MKFRFVDRIIDLRENEYIVGIKSVSLTEYFLQRPLGLKHDFPSSLMAECLFQLGNFLIYKTFGNKLALLTMFKRIDFFDTLKKGDVMTMRVDMLSTIDDSVKLKGEGFVGERKVISSSDCIGKLIDLEELYNPEKFALLFDRLSRRGDARHGAKA